MRQVFLSGNVGRDTEVQTSAGGNEFAKTSLAVSVYNSKTKEYETEWYNLLAFGKTAERMGTQLLKGTKVTVHGELAHETFVSKTDGLEKTVPVCTVANFEVQKEAAVF